MAAGALLMSGAILVACSGSAAEQKKDAPSAAAVKLREDALAAARVWEPPAVPIGEANLRENPVGPGGFSSTDEVTCRFSLEEVGGTTPKFYCTLPNGEAIKVKYGSNNPELPAEVAATRLLAALGFPADRMYVVRRVRCAGCPTYPFYSLRCLKEVNKTVKSACVPGGINYDQVTDFDSAVIERRLEGRKIEATDGLGWAWYELDRIQESQGGSPRAHVDALRLLAMVLAHWDNKAENQRLICPPDAEGPSGSCTRPLALLQDVGATFGPVKADLPNWRNTRVFKDGAACAVSMKTLPWNGATFPDWTISEAGRQFLLGLLDQLSDQQLRDLFDGSRMTSFEQVASEGRDPGAWMRAFKDKVKQIREAGPCPDPSR